MQNLDGNRATTNTLNARGRHARSVCRHRAGGRGRNPWRGRLFRRAAGPHAAPGHAASGRVVVPQGCREDLSLHRVRLRQYRGLIQSLVARELKARYRGSVLGFFWSFFNPLLLLTVYTFVFSYVLPPPPGIQDYALFLFCGLLPWTWFNTSLVESSNVLIAGGNLIKKVMFPAEILPIVTLLANLVHFLLGLPILTVFLIYYNAPLQASELAWFPVVVLVQLVLTLGLALILSALTVHFRDIK